MTEKSSTFPIKKDGEVFRSERVSISQQAESTLKKAKDQAGKVILVAITERTTIELPACLSPQEVEERVAKYIRLHTSTI